MKYGRRKKSTNQSRRRKNMSAMNRVQIMGNVTRTPELRYTRSRNSVLDLGVAINEKRRTGDDSWIDEVTFVDVTLWGRRAEIASQCLGKGDGFGPRILKRRDLGVSILHLPRRCFFVQPGDSMRNLAETIHVRPKQILQTPGVIQDRLCKRFVFPSPKDTFCGYNRYNASFSKLFRIQHSTR